MRAYRVRGLPQDDGRRPRVLPWVEARRPHRGTSPRGRIRVRADAAHRRPRRSPVRCPTHRPMVARCSARRCPDALPDGARSAAPDRTSGRCPGRAAGVRPGGGEGGDFAHSRTVHGAAADPGTGSAGRYGTASAHRLPGRTPGRRARAGGSGSEDQSPCAGRCLTACQALARWCGSRAMRGFRGPLRTLTIRLRRRARPVVATSGQSVSCGRRTDRSAGWGAPHRTPEAGERTWR